MPFIPGFLHTAAVHQETFNRLLSEGGWSGPIVHLVHPDLLQQARQEGQTVALIEATRQALLTLVAQGAERIICTCSTIGGLAESLAGEVGRPILRVDRPLAEAAVRRGGRIVVLATLDSTLASTRALLTAVAAGFGRQISLTETVIPDAWTLFEAGDQDGYWRLIAAAIDKVDPEMEVIVLAQASMAGASRLMRQAAVPVMSSPDRCVAYLTALSRGSIPTG